MTAEPRLQLASMPWYPRDFRSATLGWPLVARAVYRELLDAQWDVGGLPTDAEMLRAICMATPDEWRLAWPIVAPKFERGVDGRLRNLRLEAHRERALQRAADNRDKAKKAANARWTGNALLLLRQGKKKIPHSLTLVGPQSRRRLRPIRLSWH